MIEAATLEAAERLTEYVFSRHTWGVHHSPDVVVPDMPRLNDDLEMAIRRVEDERLASQVENMESEGLLYIHGS